MTQASTLNTSAATSIYALGAIGSYCDRNARYATAVTSQAITWLEWAEDILYPGQKEEPTCIIELDDERYTLLEPIPVEVDRDPEGGWVAFVRNSSIGMPGESREEAVSELKGAILDIYEVYSEEPTTLGPGPAREWSVLRRYISHH